MGEVEYPVAGTQPGPTCQCRDTFDTVDYLHQFYCLCVLFLIVFGKKNRQDQLQLPLEAYLNSPQLCCDFVSRGTGKQ